MNADDPVIANPYFGARSPAEVRRIRRFTLAACGCACLLGYAIVVPLRLAGIAPPHVTRLSTVAILPFAFGGIGVGIVVPAYFPRHPRVALIIGTFGWMAIFAAIFAAAEQIGD